MKSADGFLFCYRRNEPPQQEDGYGHTWPNKSLAYWVDMIRTSAPNSKVLPIEISVDATDPPDPWDQIKSYLDKSATLDKITVPNAFEKAPPFNNAIKRLRLELKDTLQKHKGPIPSSWLQTIKNLDKKRKESKTISQAEFAKLTEATDTATLLQYLHGCGELFHDPRLFDGPDYPRFSNGCFDSIYVLFDREKGWVKIIQDCGGKFPASLCQQVWRDNTQDEHKLFLSMMESCAVAFMLIDAEEFQDKVYYIPELGEETNKQWNNFFNPNSPVEQSTTYKCKMLHRGVVNAWMTKVGSLWKDSVFYFRNGIGLSVENNLIQVEFKESNNLRNGTIDIRIKGENNTASQKFITEVLRSLEETLENANIRDYNRTPISRGNQAIDRMRNGATKKLTFPKYPITPESERCSWPMPRSRMLYARKLVHILRYWPM